MSDITPTAMISKELFHEAWEAIRTNNHAAIRAIKSAHPDLTMYSGYRGDDCHCGCPGSNITLMSAFCEQAEHKWETNEWGHVTTTDATHALLFELGLMERDDADMIYALVGNNWACLENKELAADLLEHHMEQEKIRNTLILDGTGRLYAWKDMPLSQLQLWLPSDPANPEHCRYTERSNAVDIRIAALLGIPAAKELVAAEKAGRRRSRRLAEKKAAGPCWETSLRVNANAHSTLMSGKHIKTSYDHS